jgi:DNA-directed RNA polymerase specialized sigma24 family protein
MPGGPEDKAAYLALMAAQPWGQLHADLLVHLTKAKRRSPQEAEEIAADCIARVYDPARSPWEPERGGALLAHLEWVARSVMDNAGKKRKRQKTTASGDDDPEPLPDSNRDAVARHAHDSMMAEQRAKLLAALAGKPRALEVLALEEDGVTTVDAQHAEMPGASRAQVYEARRAVYEAARALMARERDPEVRRAWGLRQMEAVR